MVTMFNSLSGQVSRKAISAQGAQVCLLVGGVEWIADTSRNSLQSLPPIGGEARLFTYLIHREDQMYLIGFAGEAERAMFIDLIKVEGIGAKAALKILSAVAPERLAGLLEAGDIDGLEALPGLGKKTAQKMVLALKGKLSLDESAPAGAASGSAPRGELGEFEDLAQALVAMGYERKSVAEAIKRLAPEFAGKPRAQAEQEMMRRAIIELS
jgi:Holliday junction DNA helicase RuvA